MYMAHVEDYILTLQHSKYMHILQILYFISSRS